MSTWEVKTSKRLEKDAGNLPADQQKIFAFFKKELRERGPVLPEWRNFKKLEGTKACYHCHLSSGKTTYVVVWTVLDKKRKVVEIRYVGTHEAVGNYRKRC